MSNAHQLLADPVTRHMRTDPTRIRAGLSVARALDYIRDHEVGGRVVYFYVVDDDDRLVGVVPTKGEWTGKVERTRHEVPRLPIDNVRYRLKASPTTAAGVAALLTKFGKGEVTGVFTVTGTGELTDMAWVVVDRIEPRRRAPEHAGLTPIFMDKDQRKPWSHIHRT